ncbi:MAG: aminomethyl-transferring glycine dehydrogenase subunit GcvPA [Nitrospinae bacterium]|nr:aminomethyl-transferring glycine dehydrogenase subunit GcvPA [Nitrospinota bacterium]
MRYIPLTPEDRKTMLSSIGAASVESLFSHIRDEIRFKGKFSIPTAMSEQEVMRFASELAAQNSPAASAPCFLGAGAYNHFVPSAVDQLIMRSEFYTSYTPYQPEISQGNLQAIYEYQSYVCSLFNMEVANASMYDGASALAEAVLMACRITGKNEVVISDLVHPRWRKTVATYVLNRGTNIIQTEDHPTGKTDPERLLKAITQNTSAVVVQSPNFFGNVEDWDAVGKVCREKGVLFIACTAEAMSLGLLRPAGDFGADIVVGEGQSLGLGLNFGGPYLGMFATREKHLRQTPGRICGRTTDKDGKKGFVLTMSTREQHIRREKATSNICSNQALCALTTTIYLTLMGKGGFSQTAKNCHYAALALKQKISSVGNGARNSFDLPFFNEFLADLPVSADELNKRLAKKGAVGGYDVSRDYPKMENKILLAATELTTPAEIDLMVKTLGEGK